MRQYLQLLRQIREHGVFKPTRAIIKSTGEKIEAQSIFGWQCRFDLAEGFPIVTTKRIPFRQVATELAWFISGSTNISYLRDNKVTIWDEWVDDRGELGPVYGKQWRDFGGVDQVQNLLNDLRRVARNPQDPVARRLILSAWNPPEIPQMALPPCHVMVQFSVMNERLSSQLYMRSSDVFLGTPWNIASYALLTQLLAHVVGLDLGEFLIVFGDAHIYRNHIDAVDEQLRRDPYPLPKLVFDKDVDVLDFQPYQANLEGYRSHPSISGEVAV